MTLPAVRRAAPTLLVAAVFVLTVELLRGVSPLLDLASADLGVVGAARLALLIFLAPALVGVAVAGAGAARTAIGATALLVVLRLVAQAQEPATLLVVGAGAAAGVAALVLAVRQTPTPVAATTGVLAGGAADLAIRSAYGSWDPLFRPGVGPWLVVLAVVAVAAGSLLLARPSQTSSAGRAAALGPYLALYLMLYGSAPVVAAHAGVPLPLAGVVLIVAALAGMELVRRSRLPGGTGAIPEPDRWFAGMLALLAVTGAVVAAYLATGVVVLVAAAGAAVAAAVLFARALTDREGIAARRPAVGYAGAAAAAGLGFVLPVMIYQVHYDLEFPFDNRLALVAIAVLLGVAGLGGRPRERERDRRRLLVRPAAASAVAAVTLLVPLAMLVTRPAAPAPEQSGDAVRLMSWNVMYGRDHPHGTVDPEAVATAIEVLDPDVVLLQEVSRGWPIGGGVDMLEYLSGRLAMPYEWSPAADGLFGNAMLTRMDYSDVEIERFPFVQGPMDRSYLAATLTLDGGQRLRVFNAHFQHRKESTPTRLVHTGVLHEEWDGAAHTVIAGDFNFWPSWEEADLWETAGFVSAQDVTGHGAEFTVPSDDPDNRVDWIFGTPDLAFADFDIRSGVANSDHFPLVVTVTLD